MIVKILSRKTKSYSQLLHYMLDDEKQLNLDGKKLIITHNLTGKSIVGWERQLQENEVLRIRRRKDSTILTHEMLSWHKEDAKNITIKKLEAIARQYIKLRNPKGMYVACGHFSEEHFHIHLLVSGVELGTGKAMRMSKTEFFQLKKNIQDFQLTRFPELSHSTLPIRKTIEPKTSDKEFRAKSNGRESEKEKVIKKVNIAYQKAITEKHFVTLLNASGLQTYIRGGRLYGILTKKYKYRFGKLGISHEMIAELSRTRARTEELMKARTELDKEIIKER